MTGLDLIVLVVCVLGGGAAGALVPSWVARLPEPREPEPAEHEATGAEGETKTAYVDLARWPGLRPMAVVLVALSCGLVAARIGAVPVLPAVCYVCLIGVILGYVDVREHLLPNAVLLPSYGVVAALLALAAAASNAWQNLTWAAAGGGALWLFFALAMVIYPSGMGFGDVKLAGVLGTVLGWFGPGQVVVGVFAAFVLGGLTGVALVVARRANRKSAVPFGPFLLVGFLVAVVVGDPLIEWYLGA